MPRRCVAMYCSQSKGKLYEWPKDSRARKWTSFVRTKRMNFTPSSSSVLCYKHFKDTCFHNRSAYDQGFAKKLLLNATAVPTIHLPPQDQQQVQNPPVQRAAADNRERMRAVAEASSSAAASEQEMAECGGQLLLDESCSNCHQDDEVTPPHRVDKNSIQLHHPDVSARIKQEEEDLPYIKEEQEEHFITVSNSHIEEQHRQPSLKKEEEDPPYVKEEVDITNLTGTSVCKDEPAFQWICSIVNDIVANILPLSSSSNRADKRYQIAKWEASGIRPYMFEPYLDEEEDSKPENSGRDNPLEADSLDDQSRLGNTEWCSCGTCVAMPTVGESLCCREQERTRGKMEDAGVKCITQHSGFQPVCLNIEVLQTAYFAYRQSYQDQAGNKSWSYVTYPILPPFVRCCHFYLPTHPSKTTTNMDHPLP
ncbi:uncharacterized protein LOC130909582 isoform X2 [Corythoichthys intestinalis]|uniref:uncharacterized protein LOC130909582 isoform X2 n=1 Tax=Corythoichthys intestinalis TaxID=161448 RepID=UPI0025A5CCE5|nr:uncharacterized protein LOC130909582 isoform X2 [Corythoichthys intestinalis]